MVWSCVNVCAGAGILDQARSDQFRRKRRSPVTIGHRKLALAPDLVPFVPVLVDLVVVVIAVENTGRRGAIVLHARRRGSGGRTQTGSSGAIGLMRFAGMMLPGNGETVRRERDRQIVVTPGSAWLKLPVGPPRSERRRYPSRPCAVGSPRNAQSKTACSSRSDRRGSRRKCSGCPAALLLAGMKYGRAFISWLLWYSHALPCRSFVPDLVMTVMAAPPALPSSGSRAVVFTLTSAMVSEGAT